jgi:hypothetical protein
MTIESSIFSTLGSLVSNRCYPDIAPDLAVRPYITYQQVGGSGVNFVDSTTPSKKNARFQINVWADTRGAAATLSGQVEDALRAATTLQTVVLGAPVASYEVETGLRGTRQDFSFWQ